MCGLVELSNKKCKGSVPSSTFSVTIKLSFCFWDQQPQLVVFVDNIFYLVRISRSRFSICFLISSGYKMSIS